METKKSDFHNSFYIPAIKKLAYNSPHLRIIGTNHCGEMRRIAFKGREVFQYVLCHLEYTERIVASFDHQIQS